MEIKISDYSSYDNYTVKCHGENYSDIYDKLIRLAAKITESYASDIFYDLEFIKGKVENKEAFEFILSFRECGTHMWKQECYKSIDCNDIQYWKLIYNPENKIQMELKRQSIYKSYN